MKEIDKEKIALLLIDMAKEVKAFLSSDENKIYPAYNSTYLLVSSFEETRKEILEKLLSDPVYAAKFSEEYVEKLLKENITAMVEDLRKKEQSWIRPQAIARKAAKTIFTNLDSYTTSETLYLPVTGITLQLEEGKLELGNITLQTMTKEKGDELLSHITSTVMTMLHTPEEKQALVQYFTQELQQIFKKKDQSVYAVYRCVAEPIQAERRAQEECYKVFDVLRYALPFLTHSYPMGFSIPVKELDNNTTTISKYSKQEKKFIADVKNPIVFGLEGEAGNVTETISNSFILRDPPGFSWNSSRKGTSRPLKITAHLIEGLKQAKVFEALQLLKKEDASLTNFERCILRSIHWFANAQIPMQPEYILLGLMSSIEAFLNPPDGHEQTTMAVVEGVAALGGEEAYIYTKKRMNQLYDKRSALSHGDHADVWERDISELRAIAFDLIHQMLQQTDEFITQKQLFEEIKKLRKEIAQSIAKTKSQVSSQLEID